MFYCILCEKKHERKRSINVPTKHNFCDCCPNFGHFVYGVETVVQQLGLHGVQAHPQKFLFVKHVYKISKTLGKEASQLYNIIN